MATNANEKETNTGADSSSVTEERIDHEVEDTFPASDPPSMTSPITGVGGTKDAESRDVSGLPADFKDNPAAQFEYGRRSQLKTQHFDTSSRRLSMGNPDIGDVDLGTIESDEPSQRDDNDLYDGPANDRGGGFEEQIQEDGLVR